MSLIPKRLWIIVAIHGESQTFWVVMELVGHRTESVYQRYDIVAERDLTDGVIRYASRIQNAG